jgi:hypothetical protein
MFSSYFMVFFPFQYRSVEYVFKLLWLFLEQLLANYYLELFYLVWETTASRVSQPFFYFLLLFLSWSCFPFKPNFLASDCVRIVACIECVFFFFFCGARKNYIIYIKLKNNTDTTLRERTGEKTEGETKHNEKLLLVTLKWTLFIYKLKDTWVINNLFMSSGGARIF